MLNVRRRGRHAFLGELVRAGVAGLLLVIASGAAATHDTIVPASGTAGGAPELVEFSGNVRIRSTLVRDPDFGKPATARLAIDLVDIVGRGLTSGAKYGSTAEFVHSVELHAPGVIELTFPFQPDSRKGHLVARAAAISLTLKFDARTGAIVGGSCRVSGID